MKKNILVIILIGIISAFYLQSCELPDNVDPKLAKEAEAKSIFASATVSLIDHVATPSVNSNISRILAQYTAETTYYDETRYVFLERNIPDSYWTELYRDVLFNLKAAKEIVEATTAWLNPEDQGAQIAAITILEVYSYQMLVDAFGDVPYSEALTGIDGNLSPKYDDAATIYADLISKLTEAINTLDKGGNVFGDYDLFFGGSSTQWKKFGASLKLRLAMRLADVNPSLSQTSAEEAVNAGVFTSGDIAQVVYTGISPYQHPWYEHFTIDGRADHIPSHTVVNIMDDLLDPRSELYFENTRPWDYYYDADDNLKDTTVEGNAILFYDGVAEYREGPFTLSPSTSEADASVRVFKGGIFGSSNSYTRSTHFNSKMTVATFPSILMDYMEVEFLLAEAAERGYAVGGTAEEHYNNAITASFIHWGGTETQASSYLAQTDVAYTTAPGTWRQKIGTQKWIALYDRGVEAWAEWRRLDYPILNFPSGMTYDDIPKRMPYPFTEDNINLDNYNAAASAIGGDKASTKLFWDVN